MNSSISSFKKWIQVFFLTWISLLLLFLTTSECLIRMKVAPEDSFEKHRALFFDSDQSNAVFGDSHGAQDFMGEKDFINLSFPSESVDIMASKIKLYFAYRQAGKIILQADPHMFSEYRIKENVKDYIQLFEDPKRPLLQILTPRHRKYLFLYWNTILCGRSFKSKFHVNPDGSQIMVNGTLRADQTNSRDSDLQTRVRLQRPQENFENSSSVKVYQSILDDLKARQAKVCLVTFPVSPEYGKEAQRFSEFEKARHLFQDMAVQHGFPYFSYWNFFQTADRFINEDHLSPQGAQELTRQIIKDCF